MLSEIAVKLVYTLISDSIQYTAQENDYSYVAENDGIYRFEFSNVPNGTDLRLRISFLGPIFNVYGPISLYCSTLI